MTCAFFLPALQLESFQVNTSRLEAVFCSILKFILSLFQNHWWNDTLYQVKADFLASSAGNSHTFISTWQLHSCIVEVNLSIWELFAFFSVMAWPIVGNLGVWTNTVSAHPCQVAHAKVLSLLWAVNGQFRVFRYYKWESNGCWWNDSMHYVQKGVHLQMEWKDKILYPLASEGINVFQGFFQNGHILKQTIAKFSDCMYFHFVILGNRNLHSRHPTCTISKLRVTWNV